MNTIQNFGQWWAVGVRVRIRDFDTYKKWYIFRNGRQQWSVVMDRQRDQEYVIKEILTRMEPPFVVVENKFWVFEIPGDMLMEVAP